MKAKILLFLSIFFLVGCKKEIGNTSGTRVTISNRVNYSDEGDFLTLRSGKFTYRIPHSDLPFKKIMLLNASLVGYITELDAVSKVLGVSSPEYIYSEKIHQQLKENKIQNIGNEQKYDVEKIIAHQPDAVFTNYIESFENTYDILRKSGIRVIFLDEYLEHEPLQKTAYVKVFGKLLGCEKASDSVFTVIKNNYDNWKMRAANTSDKPLVLMNEMYGNQWYMPGGKTFAAHFIEDANARYILADNNEESSVPLSFEEVLVKSKNTAYWVNAGNHSSKKDLLSVNPNYKMLDAYKNGNIYAVNGREKGKANDYFESGIVRADLVLKDYIMIFHPEVFNNESLTYMRQLP